LAAKYGQQTVIKAVKTTFGDVVLFILLGERVFLSRAMM
jgi:hypothetical protein